jgi:hypothetical protein
MNECVAHEKYLLGLPGFRCSAKLDDFKDQDDLKLTNPNLCVDEEQEPSFASDQDDVPADACNNCIEAELTLQQGDQVLATARVKKRKLDDFRDTWLCARLSSKTEQKQNSTLQMLLRKTCGPNATSMATSTNCLTQLSTTSRMNRQFKAPMDLSS